MKFRPARHDRLAPRPRNSQLPRENDFLIDNAATPLLVHPAVTA
jgi:hypothetical protein